MKKAILIILTLIMICSCDMITIVDPNEYDKSHIENFDTLFDEHKYPYMMTENF